ncbi:MAG: basic amino acid/polyamine antiporter, family [Blastocatellia bacterium]|jgi:APA family basic amino acid/polyamine antiporter|nr:basic amino acid/polyamine antiporter, family [Blastocatellia bacterium]
MASNLFATKPLSLLLKEMEGENRLHRVLGPVQLTALGVGAIIGTGIFILTGVAAHDRTGPALMLSFVMAGMACVFAALCYAEFASMVPVAGSAYTYAYATLGELFAWIIGWDLILEYAVGSATVAHGWSAHFQEFTPLFGFKVPDIIRAAPYNYCVSIGAGCPRTGFVPTGSYFDLPAVLITFLLTIVLVKGIKESASFNAVMVGIKLVIVLMVIGIGGYLVFTVYGTSNWHPFAPFGYTGVSFFGHTIFGQAAKGGEPLGMFAGAAIIFFAYIGFDSVSVHSEEAKQPARDVPIGIIASLIICTILYIAVSAVLTAMVPYKEINIDAPVVDAFKRAGLTWMQYLVAAGAMTGITSVLLVMMLSQPRVMLALARDGLVPKGFFGDIHPKFRTPWKSTILTGLFVAAMAGLIPLSILAEMTSIGTLFAFVIVCGAVIVMRRTNPNAKRPFRAPFVPLVPILGILTCLLLMFSLPAENWYRLIIWLIVGLVIYFLYGRRHSVMSNERHMAHELAAHGVGGQAVGDPDAPPSSPAAPVDNRIKKD